jgi:hypothetical protein
MFRHLIHAAIPEFGQAWQKDASESILDGRVEFVAFDLLEDAPVSGKDVYHVRS